MIAFEGSILDKFRCCWHNFPLFWFHGILLSEWVWILRLPFKLYAAISIAFPNKILLSFITAPYWWLLVHIGFVALIVGVLHWDVVDFLFRQIHHSTLLFALQAGSWASMHRIWIAPWIFCFSDSWRPAKTWNGLLYSQITKHFAHIWLIFRRFVRFLRRHFLYLCIYILFLSIYLNNLYY